MWHFIFKEKVIMSNRLLFVLGALTFICASVVQAGVVNVDIQGDSASTYSGQGGYADSGNNFWNSSLDGMTALVASDGVTATTVGVSLSTSSRHAYTLSNDLMADYAYSKNTDTTVDITGLVPSSEYTLYIYCQGDNVSQNASVTFDSTSKSTTGNISGSLVENGNYVVITATADATGELSGTVARNGSIYVAFNGMQIVGDFSTSNQSPAVDAGDMQQVRFDDTNSTTLSATVTDDDPDNLGQIGVDYGTVQWSCPANSGVTFADASAAETTVTFPRDGYYLLQLTAQDDAGNTATDTVVMNVLIPGEFENRVQDIVSLMTISEKVQELDANESDGISRLELPSYNYWNEALHGVGRQGLATVFPQCVGMGAMWDEELLFDIASAISDEARVKANTTGRGLNYWSPTINLARDPRWGRNEESYGEDPYHLSRMAVAFITGMQGDDPTYLKTAATPKHFIANNTESGRHTKSSDMDMRNLRELYMPAFKAAITEGKAFSVMAAYNSLNGIPCPANEWLLTDVLRNEWGFDGFVVSDCGAVKDVYSGHDYASSEADACAMAINAGTDLNCGEYYENYLEAAYNQGLVTEETIDTAVENVLRMRFKVGEFDPPELVSYTSTPDSALDSQANRDLALLAAHKSMVLLKNDGILPLDSGSISSVAVIGPNADRVILGGYSGTPSSTTSPLEGIEEKLSGTGVTVQYLEGCEIQGAGGYVVPIASEYLKPSSGSTQQGLTGSYFNNMDLSGSPVLTRVDSEVNFEWGEDSPDASVNSDEFSVRWTGILTAPASGNYELGAQMDDGARVYLDGALVASDWSANSVRTISSTVDLTAGQEYEITMEYYEDGRDATAMLVWDYGVELFADVKALAAASDVVIVCVGTDLSYAYENNDMDQYAIPGQQEDMIEAIYGINSNTVVVLVNGNPVGIEWTAENVPAILEAWYAGQSQGTAIADVLFGDYNPGGKLPETFYKTESQLPDFEDYDIINHPRTYQYFEGEVQYPFGHGLSYTEFAYSNLVVSPVVVPSGGVVTIEFDLANVGSLTGDEVPQVYMKDLIASVNVPNQRLHAFDRVTLDPGESMHLSFVIPVADIGFYDVSQQAFTVEDGDFTVYVGSSSEDIRLQDTFAVDQSMEILPPSGLTASPLSATQIELHWQALSGVSGYNLKRAVISGGPYDLVGIGTFSTNHTDSGLQAGTNYYYVVSSVLAGVESEDSAEVSGVPSAPIIVADVIMESVVLTGDLGGSQNISFTVPASGLGHNYQVFASESLTDPDWQAVSDVYVGSGGDLLFDIPLDIEQANQFYKLEVWRQ
jgi:beta-glucosidase